MISGNTAAGSHCLYLVAWDLTFGAEARYARWPSLRRAQGLMNAARIIGSCATCSATAVT